MCIFVMVRILLVSGVLACIMTMACKAGIQYKKPSLIRRSYLENIDCLVLTKNTYVV